MSAGTVSLQFADHVEDRYRSTILSFMNVLSHNDEVGGKSDYVFNFDSPSRLEKARKQLVEWEREGTLRWDDI